MVGGGHVATRRAHAWAEAGADVTVISPEISQSLRSTIERGTVTWLERGYEPGDLDGAWLVQTATGVDAVDEQVAADAETSRIWCLKGGDPDGSSAWSPAVAQVAWL